MIKSSNHGLRIFMIFITCFILLASMCLPSFATQSSSQESELKVQMYNVYRDDSTQMPSPQFKLINTGTSDIPLSDVVMRYYFTSDGDQPMAFDCWTSVGNGNLTSHFIKMATPTESADTYLEIGFTSGAGTLKAGDTVDIVSWFNKTNWSSFVQKNDYSFNGESSTYIDWNKVTVYVDGGLKWGVPPISSSNLAYPLNLKGETQGNSIQLSWENVEGAILYELEVDGNNVTNLTSNSYIHENLPPGSTHTYRVKAIANELESDWSPLLTLKLAVTETISIPTNIVSTPAETSVILTWNQVDKATGYDIDVNGSLIENITSTSFEQKNLLPESTYSYRVRAKNAQMVGDWSQAITAKTLPVTQPNPTTPLTVYVKTGTNESTQMPSPGFEIHNDSTNPVPLKDVKVRYYFTIDSEKPLSIGFWTTTATDTVKAQFVKMPIPSEQADYYLELRFTDNAAVLQPGATVGVYTWWNKSDWSSFSQTNDYSFNHSSDYDENINVSGYVAEKLMWGTEPILKDMPAFPINIKAIPEDTQITVEWDEVLGATSYDVEADGTLIENVQDTFVVNKWLNPGTRHTYKVRAKKGESTSLWSSPITVKTTGQQNLPAPNVTAQKTTNSITLNWEAIKEEITGYEVEVDGTIYDIGNTTSYFHAGLVSPSTHHYRVRAKDGIAVGEWSALLSLNTIFEPTSDFDVHFSIDPTKNRAPISPYIYGTNDDLTGTENFTARRIGGNRMSTYNWENNASNAGDDWHHSSDNYIPWYYGGVPWGGNMDEPGVGVTGFHDKSLSQGAYTLATLQTAGYVANDKNGDVSEMEKAPSSRWAKVMPAKNAPFSLVPDLTDNTVYMDEFVNFLVHKYGNAATPTGVKGYAIDNEPALWSKTHSLMHPEKASSVEVLQKSVELAKAVKKVDPYAEIFGPVLYGFSSYLFLDSDDWDSIKGSYDWYIDYYLDKMRIESAQEGKRLLDVLDLHWYPEVSSSKGVRITSSNTNDDIEVNKLRMQAPRSLWDPSYQENSWIGQHYRSYLPLIPRLQQSIQTYNSGTKLAFSEYNYGGENHVTGGIATADVLGIFGKNNVYMANYWKMVNNTADAPYSSAAFKIYNNYDGGNSKFGDTTISAETSDIENSSIYGSVFKDDNGSLHLIVINKNYDFDMNAVISLAGDTKYTSARVWAFDKESATITEREPVTSIVNNTFTYKIPELTVCHIVLSQ